MIVVTCIVMMKSANALFEPTIDYRAETKLLLSSTYDIRCTNNSLDHSDAAEVSPAGAAPTTSLFST